MICQSLLLETINYYRDNESNYYLLLLDASKLSKAFDHVECVKLFYILCNRDKYICVSYSTQIEYEQVY